MRKLRQHTTRKISWNANAYRREYELLLKKVENDLNTPINCVQKNLFLFFCHIVPSNILRIMWQIICLTIIFSLHLNTNNPPIGAISHVHVFYRWHSNLVNPFTCVNTRVLFFAWMAVSGVIVYCYNSLQRRSFPFTHLRQPFWEWGRVHVHNRGSDCEGSATSTLLQPLFLITTSNRYGSKTCSESHVTTLHRSLTLVE